MGVKLNFDKVGIRYVALLVLPVVVLPQFAYAQQNPIQNFLNTIQAEKNRAQWQKIARAELNCIDRQLSKNGVSLNQIVQRGVSPNDPRISEIRRFCKSNSGTSITSNSNPQKPQQTSQDQTLGILIPDGKYLNSQKECQDLQNPANPENTNLLIVKGNKISGWESACQIKTFKFDGNGAQIKAACSGEGESYNVSTKIVRDGNSIDFGALGNTQKYVLCEPAVENKTVATTAPNPSATENPAQDFFPDGQYLDSEAECARFNTNKQDEFPNMLSIKGNEITGWEFGCTITNTIKNGNAYKIAADCMGEGDTWKISTELKTDGKAFNFGSLSNEKDYYLCSLQSKPSEQANTKAGASSAQANGEPGRKTPKEIAFGARCGTSAAIIELSGTDTNNSRFLAAQNREQALDICTCDYGSPDQAPKGAKLEACIQDQLKYKFQAVADCSTGTIVDSRENRRKITGRIVNGEFEMRDDKTNEIVGNYSATGYGATLDQYSVLCPAKICNQKDASRYLNGCK